MGKFWNKLIGADDTLVITDNGTVDVSEYNTVEVEVDVHSEVSSVYAKSPECKLLIYIINGVAYIHAYKLYVGGNTSGLNVEIPTARDDAMYREVFKCAPRYSTAACVGKRKAPDVLEIGTVYIDGGDNKICVDHPGFYTFELSYPINVENGGL